MRVNFAPRGLFDTAALAFPGEFSTFVVSNLKM